MLYRSKEISPATKAICGLRQVGFGIDAASSERLRHRNGGKLERCNGEGLDIFLSPKFPINIAMESIQKGVQGLDIFLSQQFPINIAIWSKSPSKVYKKAFRHQNREKFDAWCNGKAWIAVSIYISTNARKPSNMEVLVCT